MVGITRAVRLDPGELRHKRKIIMPDGLDVVLYCRSKNSFVSARVAAVMRGHGIDSVYVLAGGLSAWDNEVSGKSRFCDAGKGIGASRHRGPSPLEHH